MCDDSTFKIPQHSYLDGLFSYRLQSLFYSFPSFSQLHLSSLKNKQTKNQLEKNSIVWFEDSYSGKGYEEPELRGPHSTSWPFIYHQQRRGSNQIRTSWQGSSGLSFSYALTTLSTWMDHITERARFCASLLPYELSRGWGKDQTEDRVFILPESSPRLASFATKGYSCTLWVSIHWFQNTFLPPISSGLEVIPAPLLLWSWVL